MLLPLVDTCGPLGEDGEPQHGPEALYWDRAYDSEPHRGELRDRGIDPHLAKRRPPHGSEPGVHRRVVERLNAWLHGFRKLRFVTEKTEEMRYAFLNLALSIICFRLLNAS